MEKKNTLLLTVIAVATLLVAVVGATFAYFASTSEGNTVLDVAANTASATSTFSSEVGGAISIDITPTDMIESKNNTTAAVKEAQSTISVSYDADQTLKCTYDIKFEWDTTTKYDGTHAYDVYNKTENAVKEFTYQVTKDSVAGTETNFADEAAGETIEDDATVIGSANHQYTIKVRFYNTPQQQQDTQAGKHYFGKFVVDDVKCGLAA